MRLSKAQKYLAKVMIYAVDKGYFNYGDSVEYLPKSDKFKVISSDLDKPIYLRFGAFYHDYLKLDEETQEEILQAYEDEKDHYKIRDTDCGYIFDTQFKSFASVFRIVCLNSKKTGHKSFEIDYYQNVDEDIYTRYDSCLKARGLSL